MTTIDDYAASFGEEPGYLDFAHVGPLATSVVEESQAQLELLRRSRFGSLASLDRQDERVREAVGAVTGFPPDQIAFQPNTGTGLMHVMFGLTGGVLFSAAEFPSITYAAARSAEALGVLVPIHLDTAGGPITPGIVREQLTQGTVAVAVSLVDYRTGYLTDIEGIRQVIGDRLLIVDAIQGFGVVDAPYRVADVVASGGQKWARAGWGTGFLALSERAAERLTPVFSGFNSADGDPLDTVHTSNVLPPVRGAGAFTVSPPSPIAQARFATALEGIAEVGIAAINARVAEKVSRVIELADEYAVPVSSSRAENERAGIVVLEPAVDQLTVLSASLFNHGVSVTTRAKTVRVSPHVSTDDESFDMLRASFTSYASAITV